MSNRSLAIMTTRCDDPVGNWHLHECGMRFFWPDHELPDQMHCYCPGCGEPIRLETEQEYDQRIPD